MKKINWDIFLHNTELWTILGLTLALCELYNVTRHWIWIVVIVIWCGVIHVHLKYLSGLAVGGATKEKLDE